MARLFKLVETPLAETAQVDKIESPNVSTNIRDFSRLPFHAFVDFRDNSDTTPPYHLGSYVDNPYVWEDNHRMQMGQIYIGGTSRVEAPTPIVVPDLDNVSTRSRRSADNSDRNPLLDFVYRSSSISKKDDHSVDNSQKNTYGDVSNDGFNNFRGDMSK